MKAVIQTIPSRYSLALKQAKAFGAPVDIYNDEKLEGPFKGFIASLLAHPSGDEYRLHMQDDLIYADYFKDYLPVVEKLVCSKEIHLLSLFAPRRKHIVEQRKRGVRIGSFPKFLWMQCVVMSPIFVNLLLEEKDNYKDKHDDVFVSYVLWKYRIQAKVHLPSLVQHDTTIPSTMKHANNEKRQSPIFERDFIANWKKNQGEYIV